MRSKSWTLAPPSVLTEKISLLVMAISIKVSSNNLEKSLSFYTNILQMSLLRQKEYPEGEFTLAFLGYGPESEHTALELTHNWGTMSYEIGNGFGHLAVEVEDVYLAVDKIKAAGGKVIREAGPMNAGSTIVAFIEDPDGYQIELLCKKA